MCNSSSSFPWIADGRTYLVVGLFCGYRWCLIVNSVFCCDVEGKLERRPQMCSFHFASILSRHLPSPTPVAISISSHRPDSHHILYSAPSPGKFHCLLFQVETRATEGQLRPRILRLVV